MPNQPKTPVRGVRLPEPVWKQITQEAAEDGITPSDTIRTRLDTPVPDLPAHNCQHAIYKLTCESFDALMRRAGGLCEICRTKPNRFQIDHDHSGVRGVRGLLCPKCNSRLHRVDAGERTPTDAELFYLDNPWQVAAMPGLMVSRRRGIRSVGVDPDLYRQAQTMWQHRGETFADWVERHLKRDLARFNRTNQQTKDTK